MKLLIVCVTLAAVAVSAYPGGHAESYANQNLYSGHGGGGSYGGGHDDGHEDYHHYAPQPYKYEYGVKDFHTGDNKEAWEHSDGHTVKGMYSLYEPDGTKRIVEYTADPKEGFQAKVTRVGHATHDYHSQSQSHGGHY